MKKSGVDGNSLKEATYINKSLSTLGNVFEALEQKSAHVPYRDSKLTFLLKDSLGGESKALMLVQISPSVESCAETLCSLRFASKVHSVELGPIKRNFDMDATRYKEEAKKYKDELKEREENLNLVQQKYEEAEAKANEFEIAYNELEAKFLELNEAYQSQREELERNSDVFRCQLERSGRNNNETSFLDNSHPNSTPSRFYTSLKETVEELFDSKENYQENRFRTPTKGSLGLLNSGGKKLKRAAEDPTFGSSPFQRPTKRPTLNGPAIQVSSPSASTPSTSKNKYIHSVTPIRTGDIFSESNGTISIGMNYFNATPENVPVVKPKLKKQNPTISSNTRAQITKTSSNLSNLGRNLKSNSNISSTNEEITNEASNFSSSASFSSSRSSSSTSYCSQPLTPIRSKGPQVRSYPVSLNPNFYPSSEVSSLKQQNNNKFLTSSNSSFKTSKDTLN